MLKPCTLILAVLVSVATLPAQETRAAKTDAAPKTQPPPAGPRATDWATPTAIVAATYECISGGKGEARDWGRFRALFHRGAKLVPITPTERGQQVGMMSVEDYITKAGKALVKVGFRERGIRQDVRRFGSLAQVWSTYEGHVADMPGTPYVRGINSFQLAHDGQRWWIIHLAWCPESNVVRLGPAELPPIKKEAEKK